MGKPADGAFDEAQRMIEQLAANLDPADAAALRLHSWTTYSRRFRKSKVPA